MSSVPGHCGCIKLQIALSGAGSFAGRVPSKQQRIFQLQEDGVQFRLRGHALVYIDAQLVLHGTLAPERPLPKGTHALATALFMKKLAWRNAQVAAESLWEGRLPADRTDAQLNKAVLDCWDAAADSRRSSV